VDSTGWDQEAFARRLRLAMGLADTTRKELAKDSRLSYPQVQRLTSKKGRSTPPSELELHALAAAVGVSPKWLLTGSDGDGPATRLSAAGGDRLADLEARLALLEEEELGRERAVRELRHTVERLARRLEAALEARGS
jgi:transcriptional regulator with XRE-family HTH domain